LYHHYVYDGGDDPNNKIGYKKFIHGLASFKRLRLKIKHKTATSDPTVKIGKVIIPSRLGIKNPITADATRILDKSEKYLDNASS